jgi:hypothetical protein
MGEINNVNTISLGKCEGKKQFGDLGAAEKIILKWTLKQ